MAKKKATEETTSSNTGKPAAAARARNVSRRTATDPSLVTASAATTSEEVQLAVANDSSERIRDSADSPSYDEIAEAAYQRYQRRGGSHGGDLDDWVAAEQELRNRRSK